MNKPEEFFNNMTLKRAGIIFLVLLLFAAAVDLAVFEAPRIMTAIDNGTVKKKAEAAFADIIRCLDEDDTDTLREMFCKEIQDSEDFNEKTAALADFIDGSFVSTDHRMFASGWRATQDHIILEDYYALMEKGDTSSGNSYFIEVHAYLKLPNHPDQTGIYKMKVMRYRDADTLDYINFIEIGHDLAYILTLEDYEAEGKKKV